MAIYTIQGPSTFHPSMEGLDSRSRDMRSIEVVSNDATYVGGVDYAEGYHRSAQVTPNTMPRDQGNRHTRRRAAALARHQSITTRSY